MPEDLTRRAFGQTVAAAAIGGPMQLQSGGGSQPAKASRRPVFPQRPELVSLMRRKQVSAREVMAAHLAQIERVNPKVNAIVTLVAERAMADAARADEALARGGPSGVLHGLPVAHKDLVDTAGIRTTQGSPFYRDHIPTRDALLVTRIRAAGAVTVGKTNTPEFGAGSQTFNTVFGATRNPYDLTKTAAAAAAAPRWPWPAGWCPSPTAATPAGRCETRQRFATSSASGPRRGAWRANRRPGRRSRWQAPWRARWPMWRSSSARLPGPIRGVRLALQEDGARFGASLGRDFKGARVAWWRDLGGIPFEPEIVRVVNANRRVFEDLGCVVEEAEPDFAGLDDAFATLRYAANTRDTRPWFASARSG